MKISFLKEEALETLKGNIGTNLKNYTNPTNDWITDYFDGQSPFVEYKIEVNDFVLDMSEDKPNKTDLENTKIIYTNLMMLTETQATDVRLWSGLEHGIFWDYMRYRWSLDRVMPTELNINSRFFYYSTIRHSLIRNTLSKLWWIGKLTYDNSRKDPFELTNVLKYDFTTRMNDLFSSNYSSNPLIVRAFLSSIKSFEDNGVLISKYVYREATTYLNVLGGTYILDCFTQRELAEKITRCVQQLLLD
jgi:hypothetical protein